MGANLNVSGLVHHNTRLQDVILNLNADSIEVPNTFPEAWVAQEVLAA
jgi:hypothetical protein